MKTFFVVKSGNSELERFSTDEKAQEVCKHYKGNGFSNAKVVKIEE